MLWQRAKTIMIWLFLIVDIFLVVVLLWNKTSSDGIDKKSFINVLKNNNITVREELLDTKFNDTFANEFLSLTLKEDIAKKFLKNPRKVDNTTYESEDKTATLQLYSGNIIYENKAPDFKGFSNVTTKNVNSKLSYYLKALGISKYVRISDITQKNDTIFTRYSYFFNDKELFSSNITFAVTKNGITSILGKINIPNENAGYNFTLSGIETILLNFAQNNNFLQNITVVSITPGYYCPKYENLVSGQAIPVYRIKTTDKIYIYDARDEIDAIKRQLTIEN